MQKNIQDERNKDQWRLNNNILKHLPKIQQMYEFLYKNRSEMYEFLYKIAPTSFQNQSWLNWVGLSKSVTSEKPKNSPTPSRISPKSLQNRSKIVPRSLEIASQEALGVPNHPKWLRNLSRIRSKSEIRKNDGL